MKKLTHVLFLASMALGSIVATGCSSTPAKEESPIASSQASSSVESPSNLGSVSSGRGR